MTDIAKSDLRVIDYTQYGQMLEQLTAKVVAASKKYDLIVPILRSGGFTGLHLASKLKITNILPAQYKTTTKPKTTLKKKFNLPKLQFDLPLAPRVLVVDTNTVTGETYKHVASDLQAEYPGIVIDYATVSLDQAAQNLPFARLMYHVFLTNEQRLLTSAQAAELRITNDVLVFPWEDLEEQWAEIQAIQTSV